MVKSKKNANVKNRRAKVSKDKIKHEQDFSLDLESLKLEEEVQSGKEEPDMTNIDLKNLEFNQFMNLSENQSEKGSVALERMALSAPRPVFAGGLQLGTGEEGDEFKYSNTHGADEPKYSASPDSKMERAERIDSGARQSYFLPTNPEFLFQRVADSRLSSDSSPERVERVRRFDSEKEGKMNRFEREEEKYKEYKPKVPE